jgi:hypothetical protein
MNQTVGEQTRSAIFAADGRTRSRLVRATTAAAAALLAAWLVSLVLGALGGFDALPTLPGERAAESSESSGPAAVERSHVPTRERGPRVSRVEPQGSTQGGANPAPAQRAPKQTITPQPTAPATVTAPSTTSKGQGLGVTKDPGKPLTLPGNGPSGTGAPGQLR